MDGVHVVQDPDQNFKPSPGEITYFHSPGGPGVRVESHVFSGYRVPPYYDSMIIKILARGLTRDEAILRMRRALGECVVEGVATTIPFHLEVMDDADFRRGGGQTKQSLFAAGQVAQLAFLAIYRAFWPLIHG